jgi:hypothetical protein
VIRFGDNAPSAREHLGCTGPSDHGDWLAGKREIRAYNPDNEHAFA